MKTFAVTTRRSYGNYVALVRAPDAETARRFVAEKLGRPAHVVEPATDADLNVSKTVYEAG